MEAIEHSRDICVGQAVIECQARRQRDGSYEWGFIIRRKYTFDGEEKRAWFHRPENAEDVGRAMGEALRFMAETDVERYVEEQMAKAA